MSTKAKKKSKLSNLTPEQRAEVERWLFEEDASYATVAKRCLDQFELELTKSSLGRYYRRRDRELELDRMATGTRTHANGDNGAALSPKDRYDRVLDGIELKAMELARRPLGEINVRELCELVHLIIAARREANEANRLELTRQKLEYDVAAACLEHKIEFDRICEDEKLDDHQRLRAVREELFGPNLPE